MTPERWEQVKQLLRSQYQITDEYTEQLEPGSAEILECATPLGTLKISFVSQPKMIGKKTLYSHRSGGETQVSYEFDDSEIAHHLEVFRFDEASGTWLELSPETLPLS